MATNRYPDPAGLSVIDCTGVSIGNTDIGVPEWVPTEVQPGTTPLPVYPQPSDLPPQPFTGRDPRKGREL